MPAINYGVALPGRDPAQWKRESRERNGSELPKELAGHDGMDGAELAAGGDGLRRLSPRGRLPGNDLIDAPDHRLAGRRLVTVRAPFRGRTGAVTFAQFVATTCRSTPTRFQTCAGFLLTTLTIRAVPAVLSTTTQPNWPLATALLALGPLFGIYHMALLRQLAAAEKMAGGMR